jgi:hypothetical protein
MAAPRLVLRFRELTPGIDTINEHLRILRRRRFVWWGWWKKETEPDHSDELSTLESEVSPEVPVDAWLIDTSAERLHLATVVEVRRKLSHSETTRIPAYYRKNIDEIPAWFRLSKIQIDCAYNREFELLVTYNRITFLPAVSADD